MGKQGWWRLVSGDWPKPDPNNADALERWNDKADRAAGKIYLSVGDDQRHHIQMHMDDPKKMWEALGQANQSKKPGMRFNAYDNLFLIRKCDDEDLKGLIARVSDAMQDINDLQPSAFTLADLENELFSMALICALPDEYMTFVLAFMLFKDLGQDSVQEAFRNEQISRQR